MQGQPNSPFGRELRYWRQHRGLSQLDLAVTASSTSRHISFLESGRSRPSATMVDRLCEALEIPVRERNQVFLAAGIAAPYLDGGEEDASSAPFRFALESMLANHDPFPGLAMDRDWNVVLVNRAARSMLGEGNHNLARLLFDGPLGNMVLNWEAMAWATFGRLRADATRYPESTVLSELRGLAETSLRGKKRPSAVGSDLVLCPTFMINGVAVPTVTVTARFGAARSVLADETWLELIFPETEAGQALFRGLA
jgi:transcriptional regulator with XRE-family HTH domain